MKTILCYGDSNTWGYEPATAARYAPDVRWPGILQKELGDTYVVIEEGLCGRTTVWDDPIEGYKNGRAYLTPCLDSHKPLDLVIIMLGTNDLKVRFSLPASDIAKGAGVLVDVVHQSSAGHGDKAPPVLLLAPPPTTTPQEKWLESLGDAAERSKGFSARYAAVAQEKGCRYFDTATVIRTSPIDGVHLEAREHRKLGIAVAEIIQGWI
jgi:lysophospholipase L1-like esterase